MGQFLSRNCQRDRRSTADDAARTQREGVAKLHGCQIMGRYWAGRPRRNWPLLPAPPELARCDCDVWGRLGHRVTRQTPTEVEGLRDAMSMISRGVFNDALT